MSPARSASARLWTDPLYERVPAPPMVLALLGATALLLLLTLLADVTGGLDELDERGLSWWQHRDGRLGVLVALMAITLLAQGVVEITRILLREPPSDA